VYNSSLVELGKKLLACAKDGDTEGVRLLMSRGAPFTTDWLGTSPLHLTAKFGKVDTCEVLLRAGCSRDARTKVDKTPLHIAAQEGHSDICELMLNHGADVDARDMLRMTPLHWAVERGCTQTVELLLKHGANTNLESKFDKTVLEIASENGRPDIFELLRNAEKYRVLAIDSGGGAEGGGEEENLVVSQQEVVSTGNYLGHSVQVENSGRKSLQIQNRLPAGYQLVKPLVETPPAQIGLDPVQLALNSVGEGDLGDLSEMETAQDEAMKLLASHGITMLPEEPSSLPAHNLTLTEAGKLALSHSSKPSSNNLRVNLSHSLKSPSSPHLTKVVKLQSSPAKQPVSSPTSSPAASNKPIRVIKLTPAQAEAFKKSRAAGQVMFSKEKLLASSANGQSELLPASKKIIKLEPQKPARADKEELQSKLELQLAQKAEEAERLREETRQREMECEKLKAQLKALSS